MVRRQRHGGGACLGALVCDLRPGGFDVDAAVVLLLTGGFDSPARLAGEPADVGGRRLQRVGRASVVRELLLARRHAARRHPGVWASAARTGADRLVTATGTSPAP